MSRSQLVEREVKFHTPRTWELPDLRHLMSRTERLPAREMNTVYLDTVDGRLWLQGITLRHRTSEDDSTTGQWTLTLPVAASWSRVDRDELTWSSGRDEVPDEVVGLVRGLVRRGSLQPMVELVTSRQRLLLHDTDGALAEIDDDSVTVVGGPRDGHRFRQVELQLRPGRDELPKRVIKALTRAGAVPGDEDKFARTGALGHPAHPRVTLSKKSSLGDVVRSAIADAFERLLDHDWRLRAARPELDGRDIHQARVAVRRLRSHLKTFDDVIDPVWLGHVRGDLAWLGTALGEVRDADVLADSLRDAPREVGARLAEQRRAAAERAMVVLDSSRYLDLLDRLHAAIERPPFVAQTGGLRATDRATSALPTVVGGGLRSVRRRVRKGGHRPSDRQLHKIRIKAKQLRYAAELAAPVIGSAAHRTATAAEGVQTVLGKHHDSVVAEQWLRHWAAGARDGSTPAVPETIFEAGRRAATEERRQAARRSEWLQAWKALSKPKNRRWLD